MTGKGIPDVIKGLVGAAAHHRGRIRRSSTRVAPLTQAQADVVRVLFGQLLTWPPTIPASCLQLKQVASRTGLTVRAVQERLRQVVREAERLGLTRADVLLTDPEYLYVLVQAGYVLPLKSDVADYLRLH